MAMTCLVSARLFANWPPTEADWCVESEEAAKVAATQRTSCWKRHFTNLTFKRCVYQI